MSPEMTIKLKRSLVLHEGRKERIYLDTVGKLTGGIGYNFSDRDLPDWFIDRAYDEDVAYLYAQFSKTFSWFKELNEDRQIVLIDMSFMGFKHFLSFKKMIAALEKHDYSEAAREMLNSKWAKQVGNRAIQLAEGMRNGEYKI